MQEAKIFWGVDVAKAELVISRHLATGAAMAIGNDPASINRWLKGVPANSYVAMESTGRYHAQLAKLALAAGMRVYVLNAKDVYFYAKALGARGKTDASDSAVIARYIAEHHAALHSWVPGTPVQQRLMDLLERRATLVKHRVSLRQTLGDTPELAAEAQGLDAHFDALLAALDAQVKALRASDARLEHACVNLQTLVGVGGQSATLLGVLFSRFNFANADAVVAYSGLDPRPCDSGMRKGKRRLSKRGPPDLRRMLYLMSLAACRSPHFNDWYQSLKARGFAGTQALVILARKLLRIAYAMWKRDQPFNPALLAPKGVA